MSYFHSKNLAFETPLPLRISINLPWGGYGYFLELHNQKDKFRKKCKEYAGHECFYFSYFFYFDMLEFQGGVVYKITLNFMMMRAALSNLENIMNFVL